VAESTTLNFTIGVLSSGAFAAGNIPSIGTSVTPTATVSYGPVVSTASLPITPVAFASYAEAPAAPIASIGDCVTNLLFPFISNEAFFDTSIQIANTTLDKTAFASGGAAAQNGSCTLAFYPTILGSQTTSSTGAPGTPSVASTPVIPAGGVFSFQQSSFMNGQFAKASGYLFAVCKFVDAHGFSWLGNGIPAGGSVSGLGASTISQGLLALVIPQSSLGAQHRLQAFQPLAGVTYEALAH
jgi:hypothetical protein